MGMERNLADPEKLLKGIRRERAERSLEEFIKQAWQVIEPGTKYVENWHMGLDLGILIKTALKKSSNAY